MDSMLDRSVEYEIPGIRTEIDYWKRVILTTQTEINVHLGKLSKTQVCSCPVLKGLKEKINKTQKRLDDLQRQKNSDFSRC